MKVLLLSVFIAALFAHSEAVVAKGGACATTAECTDDHNVCDLDPQTKYACAKGVCACASGYFGATCLQGKLVGAACNSTTDLCAPLSSCNATGYCECDADTTASTGNAGCEKKALSTACTDIAQCGTNANCTGATPTCSCQAGYTAGTEGNCVAFAYDATCTSDTDICASGNCSTKCACLSTDKRVTQDLDFSSGACVLDAAITGVLAGAACDITTSSALKICINGHACVQCPELASKVCRLEIVPATTAAPENTGHRTSTSMVSIGLIGFIYGLAF